MKDENFDLNLEALFAELAEITQNSDINQQSYLFLLLLWSYFEVSMSETDSGTTFKTATSVNANIIRVEQGYSIFDYGSHLKTSAGKNYGSYTTGRLLNTVQEMIRLLSERGAKQLQFDGLIAAKRFAWLECEKYKIKVTNFIPDNQTLILRDRLPRLDSLRHNICSKESR